MIKFASHLSYATAGLNHPCRLVGIALAQFLDAEKANLDALDQPTLLFGAGGDLQIAFDDLRNTCGNLLETPLRLLDCCR